ncbi:ketoacyl-synt-domain-containing protein [Punctularia strigosozonata HHB-11173 SS5]|uniref:ketoacyl-synt-domain-containing protein n=1 Tax=Punctularia strigosozonata (strain HHB-11173) TaxID=741275 RepID=UPI00044180BC|nr:ketoacyl-synt-domain-containing protein [Punctularia strigosozonata HHB-11173 SS5]EIN06889.1 ketoacyl-synt-domain-containing protein [Punctularia strigosozonata HHB-11173 SS5]
MPGDAYCCFVLEGQGESAASNIAREGALRDAQSHAGRSLLESCHQAFLGELKSLSPSELLDIGLKLESFDGNATSLLDMEQELLHHPIISSVRLCVIQLLRFVSLSEHPPHGHPASQPSSACIAGFSSGLISGAVISAGDSDASLAFYATQAVRLSFWVGYRAAQAARSYCSGSAKHSTSGWGLVLFGSTREELQKTLDTFKSTIGPDSLGVYISAATTDQCISLSGPPNLLDAFRNGFLPSSCTATHDLPLQAPYHCHDLLTTSQAVKEDVVRRRIRMPEYADLKIPLRPAEHGAVIGSERHSKSSSGSLVEELIDSVLLRPVDFDFLPAQLCSEVLEPRGSSSTLTIVNLGPGKAISRALARAIAARAPTAHVNTIDSSSPLLTGPDIPPSSMPPHIASNTTEPIAIVGMAVNFPGGPDVATLWESLVAGVNTVTEIPSSRFDISDYMTKSTGRSMRTRYGNFIENADVFDNAFFRISPKEARSMSPQQRLLLHVAYEAIEDSGYVAHATPTFDPDTFGVYVGVATNDYVLNLREDIGPHYSTGTLQAFLSGKVSYAFGFGGPSIVVDTACSSSAVAIHQACRALQYGDCNAAVAGGVNVITSPDMYLGLDKAHFLSATGQCKPWDASADGYARSEGCGMFVLKRLSDAERENDNILGIIRGTEINQSGRACSITHPHEDAQVDLFKRLLDKSAIPACRVSVVEAHGTGTQAGDPIEMRSIRAVFAAARTPDNPLHVTSIKANIGHAEAAAGAASLAKLLLMLRHNVIPANISLKTLNPRIPPLASDGTRINVSNVAWPASGKPRIAVLNSFGAAGSNCALVLEEAKAPRLPSPCSGSLICGLSAKTEDALEKLRRAYLDHIDTRLHSDADFVNFSYTATARRQQYPYRIAVSAADKTELRAKLLAAPVSHPSSFDGKVVVAFSGQGSQYDGMASSLYCTCPQFKETIDYCHAKLLSYSLPGILGCITTTPDCATDSPTCLQSAIFAIEYALAKLWMSWGLKPDAVVGHSLGEYAALTIAGVIKLDDALLLVNRRSRMVTQYCAFTSTGLMVLQLGPHEARILLQNSPEYYAPLSIACFNSSSATVVGGPTDVLKQFAEDCTRSNVKCRILDVPHAYHTAAMAPAGLELTALAQTFRLSSPKIPVVSNVTGRLVKPGDSTVFVAEYFAKHLCQPVEFHNGILSLLSEPDLDRIAAWIEMGPHPVVLPMIPRLRTDTSFIPTLQRNIEDWQSISSALARLYTVGIPLKWRRAFDVAAPGARCVSLPSYPFADNRYWIKYRDPVLTPSSASAGVRDWLGMRVIQVPPADHEGTGVVEVSLSAIAPLLRCHQMADTPLCPASVYQELVILGAQAICRDSRRNFALSNVNFLAPITLASDTEMTVRVELVWNGVVVGLSSFRISTYSLDSPKDVRLHCTGNIGHLSEVNLTEGWSSRLSSWSLRKERLMSGAAGAPPETFHSNTIYNIIFPRVVTYSEPFQSMRCITINDSGTQAFGIARIPESAIKSSMARIVFADTLLHAAGFMLNSRLGAEDCYMCIHIGSVNMLRHDLDLTRPFGFLCEATHESREAACSIVAFGTADGANGVAEMERVRFKKVSLRMLRKVSSNSPAVPAPSRRLLRRLPDLEVKAATAGSIPITPPSYSSATHRDVIQSTVVRIIADVVGMSPTEVGQNQDVLLADLGVDSLMSIELLSRMRECFPELTSSDLSSILVSEAPVRAVIDELDDLWTARMGSDHGEAIMEVTATDRSRSDELSSYRRDITEDARSDTVVDHPSTREILATVLGMPSERIQVDDNLEDLGLDSLCSIELIGALNGYVSSSLTPFDLQHCKTVGDLEKLTSCSDVPAGSTEQRDTSTSLYDALDNVVLIQNGPPNSETPPLFLIHDGSGMIDQYKRLRPLGRRVYGIHHPMLGTDGDWTGGLLEIAALYATLIQRIGGRAACLIGGWSFGGVVAFEVARQLMAIGVSIQAVIAIDSPHPAETVPMSDELIDHVLRPISRKSHVADSILRLMLQSTRALVEYDPYASSASRFVPRVILLRSAQDFDYGSYEGAQYAFLSNRANPRHIVQDWESFLGMPITSIDIPGHHFEPFEPNMVCVNCSPVHISHR